MTSAPPPSAAARPAPVGDPAEVAPVLRAPGVPAEAAPAATSPAPAVVPAAPAAVTGGQPAARAWADTARTVEATGATRATSAALAEPAAAARAAADGQAAAAAVAQGRAVAAVGTAVSTPEPDRPPVPRPGRPRARRRPWTVGGLHVLQLLVWEVAVAAVLAVHRQPASLLVPVTVVAVLAVALTAVRLRGRWLYQWLVLWTRFRTRQRRTPFGPDDDSTAAAEALLGALSRGAHLAEFTVDDQVAAMVVHAGGVTALVETSPGGDDPTTEAARTLPPLTALLPPADAGEPSVSVQLLVQTVPAPAWLGDDSPAAVSYRQLTGGAVPARRRCWVALQVLRSPDDDGLDELRATLANSVRRVRRQLQRADLRTQLLGTDDLVAALLGVAGLETGPDGRPHTGAGAPAAAGSEENWTTWRAGDLVHSAFQLLDWPLLDQPAGQQLVDRLGTTTTVSTTVAVAARRTGADEVELSTSLRVVLPEPAALADVTAQLTATAADCGARVQRLDGRQAQGMAAALPFGGFLR